MESTTYGNAPATPGRPHNADGALNKASSSAHAAVNSMAVAADEATRKAKPAIDHVAAMAHQAVDKAAGAATPAAEWLSDKGESISTTQRKLVSDASGYVAANPLKSVGLALAAGFLISRLVR